MIRRSRLGLHRQTGRGDGEGQTDIFAGAKMLSMQEPDKVDTAGDLYSAFGWAYAIGTRKAVRELYNVPAGIFKLRRGGDVSCGISERNGGFLTKRILLIWKMWISDTGRASQDIGT